MTPTTQSVVVPVEPTEAMIEAFYHVEGPVGPDRVVSWSIATSMARGNVFRRLDDIFANAFAAMLAAAPAPSSLAGGEVAEKANAIMNSLHPEWSKDHGGEAALGWFMDRLAALSPEAPAREATAFAMNGLMTTHLTLRSANVARQDEWDQDGQITAAYRGNELAGEVGEACNVIKKLERERLGILGSRATVDELADELADVLICADLIAMHYSIDLEAAIARKFNATSEKVGLSTRLTAPTDGGEA